MSSCIFRMHQRTRSPSLGTPARQSPDSKGQGGNAMFPRQVACLLCRSGHLDRTTREVKQGVRRTTSSCPNTVLRHPRADQGTITPAPHHRDEFLFQASVTAQVFFIGHRFNRRGAAAYSLATTCVGPHIHLVPRSSIYPSQRPGPPQHGLSTMIKNQRIMHNDVSRSPPRYPCSDQNGGGGDDSDLAPTTTRRIRHQLPPSPGDATVRPPLPLPLLHPLQPRDRHAARRLREFLQRLQLRADSSTRGLLSCVGAAGQTQ